MTPIVDIHTHIYPPSYMDMLRSRITVPYVHDPPSNAPPRLIILSSDEDQSVPIDQRGRPIDSSYYDINVKLAFMRSHGITTSVISLANPWLDFLRPEHAQSWAERINNDLEETCARVNRENPEKFYAFGTLPLSASSPDIIVAEIERLKTLPHLRGVIMGTTGLGRGLDDPRLDPVWRALQDTNTLLFLHPHYGLPDSVFGGSDAVNRYGHVLPLALGFPLETTIAISRMILATVFDRFPTLKILLAHSGGTLPFLAGRLESCIRHERKFFINGGEINGPWRLVSDILKNNIYLDAVVYGAPGLKAAITAADGRDNLLFGKSFVGMSSRNLK